MSDYVAKVFPGNDIDHGDAVHFKPENEIKDADIGYSGQAPDALDNRFNFQPPNTPPLNEDYDWTGSHSFSDILYSDTYWDDLRVSVNSVRVQGNQNIPTWGSWLGNLQILWFEHIEMQQVFFAVQLPHQWKEGSDLGCHAHWIAELNGTGVVRPRWCLEYSWSNIGSTFTAPGTDLTPTGLVPDETLVANRHYLTTLGNIDATGKTLSSMLVCRLYRDALHANDLYDEMAGLLEIDFHYEIDRPGSREEYTK